MNSQYSPKRVLTGMGKRTLGLKLVVIALVAVFAQNAHAQQYTLTQIPVPNLSSLPPSANVSGAYVVGYGLNNAGEVVGDVGGLIGVQGQAFLYSQGSSQLLHSLVTFQYSVLATAINLGGVIVGESENSFAQPNAVSWQNGSITDLGSLYYYTSVGSPAPAGPSSAVAINSSGVAAGTSLGVAGGSISTDTHAAIFCGAAGPTSPCGGNAILDLGTLGGNDSEALGINDSGVVVGDAQLPVLPAGGYLSHAFSYDGTLHDLGVLPGGTESSATAINASGTIVGQSALTGGTHAVVWATAGNGSYAIQDLGSLGALAGNYSQANSINSSGQIVGITTTPQNAQTAFIYSNGVMRDLNTLLPAGSSVTLYEATAINDSGQILAYSIDYATNVRTTYLLTPPSPQLPTALIESVVNNIVQLGRVTSVQANGGDFVQLTAQDSTDPNVPSSPLTYLWQQISGPNGQSFAFTNPLFDILVPNIPYNGPGVGATMTYQVTVTDALGLSASATVNIQVSAVIPAVVASIVQPPQNIVEGSLVTLDGSGSSGPAGYPLSYAWLQTTGPLVALNLSNPAKPTFTAPTIGAPTHYEFVLTVSDGLTTFGVRVELFTIPAAAITVPSVVGATHSAAAATLATSGLLVGTTTQQSSMTIVPGLVVSESPSAGASVADGSAVNLVVSTGSTCANLQLVKAAFGSKLGQPAYNALADVNHDGVINIVDLSMVSRALPSGTTCN
jgi:probable HAF family extracellular repeat protein